MRSPAIHAGLPSVCIALAAWSGSPASADPPAYVITDLGTLAGGATPFEPGSVGFGVAAGQCAVGFAVTNLPNRNFHAFAWGTGIIDLGVLAGDEHSMAYAINVAGDVVGVSYRLGDLVIHGVKWPGLGPPVSLGNLEPRDINDGGLVAGSKPVDGAIGITHAVLVTGASATDLGTLGGPSSRGMALNESGWVVGESLLADGSTTHAFVWRNGAMLDLGTIGGTSSWANDINGTTVVGIATKADGKPHATRWTLTASGDLASTTDLGTLPGRATSAAYAVNASGIVVGTSGDFACLWSGGSVTDLNSQINGGQGWQLVRATAIAPGGRIVGTGKRYGLQRAFLLSPRKPADLNADGSVGAADLAVLLSAFGTNDVWSDLDHDGIVSAADLAVLLAAWT
jgi:probable HAF family extracellular repeat protein